MYQPISRRYEDDLSALEADFAPAWYRLTTGDFGPPQRCLGDEVPPAQWWQHALPDSPPETGSDFIAVRSAIQDLVDEGNGGKFVNLAFRCAETFRETDYRGGCNGARIRFPPESDWISNEGTSDALELLEPIKTMYPDVSYADLIVLAGQTAVEAAAGDAMDYCDGRVDADDAVGSDILAPRVYSPAVVSIEDDMTVKSLTFEQGVSLFARPVNGDLSSQYFISLKAGGDFTEFEKALLEEPFAEIVDAFIADEALLKTTFAEAWTKMMTAGRYDGPNENACTGVKIATMAVDSEAPTSAPITGNVALSSLSFMVVALASLFL